MRHFLFKRHFLILGIGILLIAAMIPLATFATAPAAPTPNAASLVANDPQLLIVIHNDANCAPAAGGGPQTLFTATSTVKVDVRAQEFSTDVPEQEGLLIKDSAGLFTQTILANTGTQHFSFTAPKGDKLTACYELTPGMADNEGDFPGSGLHLIDHPAAVFLKITLPQNIAVSLAANDPHLLTVIHNDANCAPAAGGGPQTLFTATSTVKVDVRAQEFSSDVPEQEGLLLKDSSGLVSVLLVPTTVSGASISNLHFSFTAPSGDKLTACYELTPGMADNEGDFPGSGLHLIDHPAAVFL